MISHKEQSLDAKIVASLPPDSRCRAVFDALNSAPALRETQEYANAVSIRRLGYNDHGPVHMRQVALNAVRMISLLRDAGIQTSLEEEESGGFDDSLCAVFIAGFLHDIGMAIGRDRHEQMSLILAAPFIERGLDAVPTWDTARRVAIRATVMECIAGHMGTQRIHSLEAGIVLVADGCDMTKGRARIPMIFNTVPSVGDIHKYSANSIEHVRISKGKKKPVLISVEMSAEVGFFQIEEVLLKKIDASPAKEHIELVAGVAGQEAKQYL
jgi:Uncharacterized conserved protein